MKVVILGIIRGIYELVDRVGLAFHSFPGFFRLGFDQIDSNLRGKSVIRSYKKNFSKKLVTYGQNNINAHA